VVTFDGGLDHDLRRRVASARARSADGLERVRDQVRPHLVQLVDVYRHVRDVAVVTLHDDITQRVIEQRERGLEPLVQIGLDPRRLLIEVRVRLERTDDALDLADRVAHRRRGPMQVDVVGERRDRLARQPTVRADRGDQALRVVGSRAEIGEIGRELRRVRERRGLEDLGDLARDLARGEPGRERPLAERRRRLLEEVGDRRRHLR